MLYSSDDDILIGCSLIYSSALRFINIHKQACKRKQEKTGTILKLYSFGANLGSKEPLGMVLHGIVWYWLVLYGISFDGTLHPSATQVTRYTMYEG